MILYGIPTCDSCKRALKELERAGHAVAFRDVRAAPLAADEVARLVAAFGDRIVNRQSTTYRAFSDYLRAADPEAQIAANPAVMKRPVIEHDGQFWLGWDDATARALTGG